MDKNTRTELEGIIKFGNAMMQACNPNDDGHNDRVAILATSLAIRLRHPADFIEVLNCAARVHDIGKISIPKSIMANGKLNDAERAMVQAHSTIGAEALEAAGVDHAVVNIVKHHHCNWDGTGYPEGLRGEQIPLGSRILRITDEYDALINNRTYRDAMTPAQALDEMDWDSKYFDPHIWAVFKKMLAEGK